MLYRFALLLLFGCSCTAVAGQNDTLALKLDTITIVQKKVDADILEGYKNDPDFDYEMVKSTAPDWWIAIKNWFSKIFLKFFEWLFGIEKAAGAFNMFLRLLPYFLLLFLVLILIKFFINVNARSLIVHKKNEALVTLSEEEHIIKNEDIQELIQQALTDQDYRLAVRYYYLYILKLMNEKEIIVWELQKTNTDYNREVHEVDLKKPFAHITRLYEYIWYGDFPIDENKYKKVEADFVSLKNVMQRG